MVVVSAIIGPLIVWLVQRVFTERRRHKENMRKMEQVAHELKPNNGTSVKDAVNRIESEVDRQTGTIEDLQNQQQNQGERIARLEDRTDGD